MGIEIEAALSQALLAIEQIDSLVRVVLSGQRPLMSPPFERIDIRPVAIKGKLLLQVMENNGRQMMTRNVEPTTLNIKELLSSGFANILVEQTSSSLTIRLTKKGEALVHREKSERTQNLDHDRVKVRLLGAGDPFLYEVGISDEKGRIKPRRQDKYLQVEEFLRLLAPALASAIETGHIAQPTAAKPLSIVDLGCGNAYLTFATHQYLRSIGMPVHVTGIDMRTDSRNRNVEIAKNLEITQTMNFLAEEISATSLTHADVVIALHACDTATDDAIAWAVKNDAKLLLIAPCCHHDLQTQLKHAPKPWLMMTKHGLMKERLGDLLTDALRAQILKILGYRTETIEFVGGEHTPRNLMIRAIKTGATPDSTDLSRYKQMIAMWNVVPALAKRLSTGLDAALK